MKRHRDRGLVTVLLEELPFENPGLCQRVPRPVGAAPGQEIQNRVGFGQYLTLVVDTYRDLPVWIKGEELVAAGFTGHDVDTDPLVLDRTERADQFELVAVAGSKVAVDFHRGDETISIRF